VADEKTYTHLFVGFERIASPDHFESYDFDLFENKTHIFKAGDFDTE
jgi:hypothetical protein